MTITITHNPTQIIITSDVPGGDIIIEKSLITSIYAQNGYVYIVHADLTYFKYAYVIQPITLDINALVALLQSWLLFTVIHEGLPDLQGGSPGIHQHSNQPINTTSDVNFNTVNGGTLSGNNTGDQNDHELLTNKEGGSALHHYHSDQPINTTNDVVFDGLKLTSNGKTTEYIATVNEITGEIKTEVPTDVAWITNTTIIAALLLETNWTPSYIGTTIGAVEGQMYIGTVFLYVYQNSAFTRYEISRKNTTTITGNYTQLSTDDVIICNSASALTITLLASISFTDFSFKVKNIGTGTVTVDANLAETIDGDLTIPLYQWDCLTFYTNGTNWFII